MKADASGVGDLVKTTLAAPCRCTSPSFISVKSGPESAMIGKTGSIITLDILDVAMLQNVADIPL